MKYLLLILLTITILLADNTQLAIDKFYDDLYGTEYGSQYTPTGYDNYANDYDTETGEDKYPEDSVDYHDAEYD